MTATALVRATTFLEPTALNAAGTWTLLIDPSAWYTGTVTVLARAVTDLTGTITLGVAKAVTISQPGQRARYTFSGNTGQGIAINITGSTIAGSSLNFYRPNGTSFNGFGFGSGTTNLAIDARRLRHLDGRNRSLEHLYGCGQRQTDLR